MSTALDARFAAAVAKLFAKPGLALTMELRRQIRGGMQPGGTVDPGVQDTQSVQAAPLMNVTEAERIADETIAKAVAKAYINPAGLAWDPDIRGGELEDTDGFTWSVIRVDPFRSGEDVAAWRLYLAKG